MPQVSQPDESNGSNQRPVLTWAFRRKNFAYSVTDKDFATFARAIWREGAPQRKVAHTLLQRFVYLYSTTTPYSSLADFLSAYCQPINPKWFDGGSKSEAKIKRLKAKGDINGVEAEKARALKRREYATTPIEKVPKKYQNIVSAILAGKSTSPVPSAVHFTTSFSSQQDSQATAKQKAIAFATQRNLEVVPIPEGYRKGVNWFFRLPEKNPPKINFGFVQYAKFPIGLVGIMLLLLFFGRKRPR